MGNLLHSSSGAIAAGIFAGAVLAALVCYALFVAIVPVAKAYPGNLKKAAGLLTALLIIKIIALLFFSGFHIDVGTYEAWGLQLAQGGPASMYQSGYFLDYPPGYLYALWAAGAIARALGATGDELRMIIGTPALLADFALSLLIFSLMWRLAGKAGAWLGMLLFALNPALLFDTVVWIQTDSAFTLTMLLSVVMLTDEKMEAGWGLAALAVLIKPQALSLLPVLVAWTLMRANWQRWVRAGLAFIVVTVVTAAPFQVGHAWNWLPDLYLSTAAYYHETSVNAFNFIALLGGLRASDSGTLFGCSYFAIGMSLLIPLYSFALWLLARDPVRRNFWFAAFIAIFGFFMFAPRMHERYVYPAVVFAIPLAFESRTMLAVFSTVTVTCLSNLVKVLHILNAGIFLPARDTFGMTISLVNLLALFAAAYCYASGANAENIASAAQLKKWFAAISAYSRQTPAQRIQLEEYFARFDWLRADTIALAVLVGAAAALRFWHLGHPAEIVFDEVHFVGQARHYIHGEPFLDPHPPIAKLLIAAGILIFGDHPASWRVGNALMGTAMVAVTYLLGRRMFRSRLAAALAAGLIAFDGFFIVDSRIGCIDIVYLTFAAIAYLLLFRFIGMRDFIQRRRLLLVIGIVLGLCLGSKLYVPGVTFLLVCAFLLFTLWRAGETADELANRSMSTTGWPMQFRWTAGAALILGSVSGMFYLASFLPHYALGWWGGIADLLHYYKDVIWYENSVASATHPYASPWWSWPLMLRPVAYWQNFPAHGDVALIWGAGNPLTWWAVVPAMMIAGVRAVERPNLVRTFIVAGFLAYYLIWIPIGRILFLYHYMPSIYIGYLALAAILADMWHGEAEGWESFAVLLSMMPVLIIGAGHIVDEYRLVAGQAELSVGLPLAAALLIVYILLTIYHYRADRFVFVTFLSLAIILFIYYLPVWLGTPISRNGYYARMWLQGLGLRNWI
jgi:Gpi18-like mannosyltransferase/predicted membrane-bound dolichyl-phosphate-mannose-protein mannosyltransferase